MIPTIQRIKLARTTRPGGAQAIRDALVEHRQHIIRHGEDDPRILNWRWGGGRARLAGGVRPKETISDVKHTEPSGRGTARSLADEEAVKEILGATVLDCWKVVNNLTRLRPSKRERYRVAIFGSARAQPGTDAVTK